MRIRSHWLLMITFFSVSTAFPGCKKNEVDNSEVAGARIVPPDANAADSHDIFLWVASKKFKNAKENDINICVYSNEKELSSFQGDPDGKKLLGSSKNWNLKAIPYSQLKGGLIEVAKQMGESNSKTISYKKGKGKTSEVTIDGDKYAEFVSWMMIELQGRSPDTFDQKTREVYEYFYAVMDHIGDTYTKSKNDCALGQNQKPEKNEAPTVSERMSLYLNVRDYLRKIHGGGGALTGKWETGENWWGWDVDTAAKFSSGPRPKETETPKQSRSEENPLVVACDQRFSSPSATEALSKCYDAKSADHVIECDNYYYNGTTLYSCFQATSVQVIAECHGHTDDWILLSWCFDASNSDRVRSCFNTVWSPYHLTACLRS